MGHPDYYQGCGVHILPTWVGKVFMMTVFKREPREDSGQRQGSPSVSKVSSHLACPCQQDLLPGGKRVSGCSVASAIVSTPGVFVGLTFPFYEMGTNLPRWQAAARELTQTRLTNQNTEPLGLTRGVTYSMPKS